MDKNDYNESLDPKIVVSSACTCNLKKMTTIQNNMGRTVCYVACSICDKEWEITIEPVEEEEG